MAIVNRYSKSSLNSKFNKKRNRDVKFKKTTMYKTVPKKNTDIYLIATQGDRCDLIAQEWYGDSRYWWFVARVNHLNSMNIPVGTRLRIPKDLSDCGVIDDDIEMGSGTSGGY
jgi:hypothetical protein